MNVTNDVIPEPLPARALTMLLEGLTESAVPADVAVRGLAVHSKQIHAGDLFIALRGRHFNGLDFLPEAAALQAAAVVCDAPPPGGSQLPVVPVAGLAHKVGVIADRFFAHPSARMQVIAVTGTDGKTSVAHLIAEALHLSSGACGLIGTLGYGCFGALRESTMTTPDATHLHRELYALSTQGVGSVVMEASSHGLAQGRLAGLDIDVAIFTNLGRDHLDYHASQKDYAEAKATLFKKGLCKQAVINAADSFGCELIQRCSNHCEVISYSSASEVRGDVNLSRLRHDPSGLSFELCVGGDRFKVESPLLGRFNADNLLAAFAALFASGMAPAQAAAVLSKLHSVRGRMQRIRGAGRCVVIDYAHTPGALSSALQACRELTAGRLWCVFGCGGDRDRGKRALMGKVASDLADRVVVSNDNPRGENPVSIFEDIRQGLNGDVQVIYDRASAIRYALSSSTAGDCILIAGKGHESFQLIGGQRLPFDDAAVARCVLTELRSSQKFLRGALH